MNPILARGSLGAALLLLVTVDLLLPAVRHYRRTGTTGIALLRADPVEGVVGVAAGLGALAIGAWTLAFALLGPEALGVATGSPWLGAAGVLLLTAGLAIVTAAQAQMGSSWRVGIDRSPTALVTHGLYRSVRNPIYTGLLLLLGGIAALAPSPISLVLAGELALWISLQARLEEAHLSRLHGAAYLAYGAGTGRFFPGFGQLSPAGGEESAPR